MHWNLASRNIVHLQKIILRCVGFCFSILHWNSTLEIRSYLKLAMVLLICTRRLQNVPKYIMYVLYRSIVLVIKPLAMLYLPLPLCSECKVLINDLVRMYRVFGTYLVQKEYLAQLRVGYGYLADYPNNRPIIISLRYFFRMITAGKFISFTLNICWRQLTYRMPDKIIYTKPESKRKKNTLFWNNSVYVTDVMLFWSYN